MSKPIMMEKYYSSDNQCRGYCGYSFKEEKTIATFQNQVKNLLLDKPQRNEMIEILNSLQNDTGFKPSETLLADIQALDNERIDFQHFRIGEALAEVVLTEHFQCRFYWNELRDARNPRGNKTGADLVGFIEIDGNVLFLFGEVKTSSEQKSPPQVMTNPSGIEKQLKDLYSDTDKRRILISYIQSKLKLNDTFKLDFETALNNYYKENGTYVLYGVLVRDTQPDENDLKPSYERLKEGILKHVGLKLMALYVPISSDKWLSIINGENYAGN